MATLTGRGAGKIEFGVASAVDDADVRELLRGNPMPGEISVTLEREPDAGAAGAVAGDVHHTIVARDACTRRLVGMGSRTVYRGFVNGAPCRIGYLSQLRVARAYRGRIRLLKEGYRLLRSLRQGAELPFDVTTIVEDNHAAHRVLNAGLTGLPVYRAVEPFTTSIVPLWRRLPEGPAKVAIGRGGPERVGDIAACLQRNGARFQFAPAWTVEDLRSPVRARGLSPQDFFVAVERGRVTGCLALWDQTSFKQIVVRGYGSSMRRWRPWMDLCSRVFGTPRLPAPGSPIAHVFVSHVAVDDDRADVFRALFAAACNEARARRQTCLIAGFAARHPFVHVLRRLTRAWTYASVIHTVQWDDRQEAPALDGRIPHLEVALL